MRMFQTWTFWAEHLFVAVCSSEAIVSISFGWHAFGSWRKSARVRSVFAFSSSLDAILTVKWLMNWARIGCVCSFVVGEVVAGSLAINWW